MQRNLPGDHCNCSEKKNPIIKTREIKMHGEEEKLKGAFTNNSKSIINSKISVGGGSRVFYK